MIYIVTVATAKNYKNPIPGLLDKRTMGYFNKLEDAIASVKKDGSIIYEEIYEYAIIESIEEGLYRYTKPEDILWFLYNEDKQMYEETNCPKDQKHVIGFWH